MYYVALCAARTAEAGEAAVRLGGGPVAPPSPHLFKDQMASAHDGEDGNLSICFTP